MSIFRRKSEEAPTKQRTIFIVRAVCPEWMIAYISERARQMAEEQEENILPSDIREDIVYLTNNLGLQVPTSDIFLISNGGESNWATTSAIKEKFARYNLVERPSDWAPNTNQKLGDWLVETWSEWKLLSQGTLIVVVDQATFDDWVDSLHLEEPFDDTCLLMTDQPDRVLSVA